MYSQLKHGLCIFALLLIVSSAKAQNSYLPYSSNNKKEKSIEWYRNIELAAGYIPQSDDTGLKGFLAVNNLVLKRLGGYTALEYDLETQKLTSTFGGSISLHKYFYLWGGIDLFSSKGFIQNGFHGPRKEIGLGLTPYKRSVLRLGWSNSVGFSIAAGFHIPF